MPHTSTTRKISFHAGDRLLCCRRYLRIGIAGELLEQIQAANHAILGKIIDRGNLGGRIGSRQPCDSDRFVQRSDDRRILLHRESRLENWQSKRRSGSCLILSRQLGEPADRSRRSKAHRARSSWPGEALSSFPPGVVSDASMGFPSSMRIALPSARRNGIFCPSGAFVDKDCAVAPRVEHRREQRRTPPPRACRSAQPAP